VRYIDARKGRWGVEPICRALQFAPATYYAARCRPPSPRRVRDEELKAKIAKVHADNLDVYGADRSGPSSTEKVSGWLAARSSA
jgi:putative transposase